MQEEDSSLIKPSKNQKTTRLYNFIQIRQNGVCRFS